MKNLHLMPTDKPSKGYILGKCIKELSDVKVGQFTKTHYLMFSEEYFQPQNIYITNDEEIKEGDWVILTTINELVKVEYNLQKQVLGAYNKNHKKIILTTDQDLIKDGVQAIDDEFLNWFVNNSSCDKVEVETYFKKIGVETDANGYKEMDVLGKDYKIIIPPVEPNPFELPDSVFHGMFHDAVDNLFPTIKD